MIPDNIKKTRDAITLIAQKCDRDPNQILLLAVSKTKPVTDIEIATTAGQTQFGENYVQEGIDKIRYFNEKHRGNHLVWHFIGHLQSNKTRDVAEYFDWVQTVDRAKIATRLSAQRPANFPPLNVLIQINISNETSKSGIFLAELPALAAHIAAQPNLCLRGLMAIPAPGDAEALNHDFAQMKLAFDALKTQFSTVDTLSMGMSDDMKSAIIAGSTMVRIGNAIFGARNPAVSTASGINL